MKCFYIVLGTVFIISCAKKEKVQPENIVATVYEYVLTKDEFKKNLPKTTSIVDSLKKTQEFIQAWSRKKLLYKNALINLENTDELDQLVQRYREELYVSYYKNALVNKKLDTLVLEKEIDSFYQQNKQSFHLNEALVKFKYIHVDRRNKERSKIKELFETENQEDRQQILAEHSGYQDYYFNDSVWVSLKGIYNKKPDFPVLSNADLIKTNKVITKQGVDRSTYYIVLKEVLQKKELAPLLYVKPTIKNILVHKNKIKFFDQMEQILIDDAVKQNKYEVY